MPLFTDTAFTAIRAPDAPDCRHPTLRSDSRKDCFVIWLGDMSSLALHSDIWINYLDSREQDRAAKFVHHCNKADFITRRFLLRCILAKLLAVTPADIIYNVNCAGKISLHDPIGAARPIWHFNMSHASNLTAIALHPDGEIGVDIEAVTQNAVHPRMREEFCTPAEQQWIADAPNLEVMNDRLLRLWTAKEAILKYLGTGLLIPMRDIEVSVFDSFYGANGPGIMVQETSLVDYLQRHSSMPGETDTLSGFSAGLEKMSWPPILHPFTPPKEIEHIHKSYDRFFGGGLRRRPQCRANRSSDPAPSNIETPNSYYKPGCDAEGGSHPADQQPLDPTGDQKKSAPPSWLACLAAPQRIRINHFLLSDPVRLLSGYFPDCATVGFLGR